MSVFLLRVAHQDSFNVPPVSVLSNQIAASRSSAHYISQLDASMVSVLPMRDSVIIQLMVAHGVSHSSVRTVCALIVRRSVPVRRLPSMREESRSVLMVQLLQRVIDAPTYSVVRVRMRLDVPMVPARRLVNARLLYAPRILQLSA